MMLSLRAMPYFLTRATRWMVADGDALLDSAPENLAEQGVNGSLVEDAEVNELVFAAGIDGFAVGHPDDDDAVGCGHANEFRNNRVDVDDVFENVGAEGDVKRVAVERKTFQPSVLGVQSSFAANLDVFICEINAFDPFAKPEHEVTDAAPGVKQIAAVRVLQGQFNGHVLVLFDRLRRLKRIAACSPPVRNMISRDPVVVRDVTPDRRERHADVRRSSYHQPRSHGFSGSGR
jgi:hypothetical protein